MLQANDITQVIYDTRDKQHHLETNGDLLTSKTASFFNYICVSPKDIKTLKRLDFMEGKFRLFNSVDYDVKVVTDLDLSKDMIKYATMLMPLTTNNTQRDKEIQQDVWNYCIKHNIKYTPRIHRDVWGNKMNI